MISDADADISNALSREVFMPSAKVIEFSETDRPMTYAQGLAFIKRMRRQLDRFDVTGPGKSGKRMDPETEARIRQICDEVEAEFRSDLGII
jgi:hypothetical protein